MSRQANTDTDTNNEKRVNIAASVSDKFQEQVRKVAKEAKYTVSTWLNYHVERALGLDPDLPDYDAENENITISTAVNPAVRTAIQSLPDIKNKSKSQADWLREVAASAAGYDLKDEPERFAPGEAFKKAREKARVLDTVMLEIWEEDPSMLVRILARKRKSFTDIGFTDAMVNAAIDDGSITQDEVDALNANAESNQPVPVGAADNGKA